MIYPWILNNGYIIPDQNFGTEQSLTLKRDRRPVSEKSCLCLKKKQPLSQMHFCKKINQTNPLFEDESATKLHSSIKISILQRYSGI